jgi:hypothetical protein
MLLDVEPDANKYVFMPAGPAGMGFAYFDGFGGGGASGDL